MANWAESCCVKWEVVYHYDDFPDVAKRVSVDTHEKLENILNDSRITIRTCTITYKYPNVEVSEIPSQKVHSLRQLRDVQRQSPQIHGGNALPLIYKSTM